MASSRASLRSSDVRDGDSVCANSIIEEFRAGLDPKIRDLFTVRECTRFINARPKSIKKACEMATNWYEWRHSLLKPFPPSNIQYTPNVILLCPDQPYDHPYIHLTPVCHNGFDKEGSPIYWERTGLIQSNFGEVKKHFTADQLVLYHIQSQEVSMMRLHYATKIFGKEVHQVTAVFDMKYLTMSLDMECIYYVKAILDIDQAFYPECLKTLFIINCPWYFTGIYAMFKPFIDKKTATKFQLLGSNYLPTLEKYIDRSQIPSELGGDHENYPWLQFAPNSGATENDLIEHLLNTYNPETIATLLTPVEMTLMQEAIETRGQRLIIPADVVYDEASFPTMPKDQLARLAIARPANCHDAFLVIVAVPEYITYSKNIFPSLSDEQLASLSSRKPKTLYEICKLLNITDLYRSELNLQKVMDWLLTHATAHPELANRPEVQQARDEYQNIVRGVLGVYFYVLRRKNEGNTGLPTAHAVTGMLNVEPSLGSNQDELTDDNGHFLSLANVEDSAFDEGQSGDLLVATNSPVRRHGSISASASVEANRKPSWAQAAGRSAGPPEYQIGDLTKSVVRKVVGSSPVQKSSFTTSGAESGALSPNSNINVSAVNLMKTKIVSTEQTVEALMYVINVAYKDNKSWQVMRRYSDFVEFYSLLEPLDARSTFPSLPRKVFFGSSSSAGVIKSRIPKLDAFLTAVLEYFGKCNLDIRAEYCPLLLQFIDPSGNRYDPSQVSMDSPRTASNAGGSKIAARRDGNPSNSKGSAIGVEAKVIAATSPLMATASPVTSTRSTTATATGTSSLSPPTGGSSQDIAKKEPSSPRSDNDDECCSTLSMYCTSRTSQGIVVCLWVAMMYRFYPDATIVGLQMYLLLQLLCFLLYSLFVELSKYF